MPDREFIVRFEGDKARIELVARGSERQLKKGEYRIQTSSAQRAELIARAMRKDK